VELDPVLILLSCIYTSLSYCFSLHCCFCSRSIDMGYGIGKTRCYDATAEQAATWWKYTLQGFHFFCILL